MKDLVLVFTSVFLAELGDKTQLATLFYAMDNALTPGGVFVAASSALVSSTLLAVVVGALLARVVPPATLKTVGGVGFIAIGVWMLLAGWK